MIRDGADESGSPKYAHIERERRWLIDPAERPKLRSDHVLIEDRYITGTRLRLRRMTAVPNGKVALKLTKKYDANDPLARAIVTAYLDAAEYALFSVLPGVDIVKRRYRLPAHDVAYSIDRFEGGLSGLELAEIEWADDAGLRRLPPPPGTIEDVSADIRYQGGMLALHGIPKEV